MKPKKQSISKLKKKHFQAQVDFTCGSSFQEEFMKKTLETILGTFKIFSETKHKGNKVDYDIFLNDIQR